jgi:transcriptional regulator with XRE-family HTH domain
MTIAEIGQLVIRRRELLRLRQEDLSEMSGIAIKTIHLIEKGSGNPSIATIEKLAIVLGLELMLQVKKTS